MGLSVSCPEQTVINGCRRVIPCSRDSLLFVYSMSLIGFHLIDLSFSKISLQMSHVIHPFLIFTFSFVIRLSFMSLFLVF
jgi:hypothetical protein